VHFINSIEIFTQYDDAFDFVLEFLDISWPVVFYKFLSHIFAKRFQRLFIELGLVYFSEVIDQTGDVFGFVTQRFDIDLYFI
jgi:hypothetical protein